MVTALNCNGAETKQDTTTVIAHGDSPGEARHNAREHIDSAVREKAWEFARAFECTDDDCRIKKVVLRFEPKVEDPIQPPQELVWNCQATCDWWARVSCPQQAQLPPTDEMMEEQTLDCNRKEKAFGCKTAHGAGSDPEKLQAIKNTIEATLKQLWEEIEEAINKVSCGSDCPKKKITILTGRLTDVTDQTVPQPNAAANFVFNMDVRWAVWVTCLK